MAGLGAVPAGVLSVTCTAVAQSKLSTSEMHGVWESQMMGDGRVQLGRSVDVVKLAVPRRPQFRMMAGKDKGKGGVFAPIVVVTRNVLGAKKFNQLRGKGIALHSQVITEFCKSIGADAKQRQGLIRLAKKNGEKLGFLA